MYELGCNDFALKAWIIPNERYSVEHRTNSLILCFMECQDSHSPEMGATVSLALLGSASGYLGEWDFHSFPLVKDSSYNRASPFCGNPWGVSSCLALSPWQATSPPLPIPPTSTPPGRLGNC